MQNINKIKAAVNPTSNSFLNNLAKESSKTLTDNGAITYNSTSSYLLDFFAQAGAMRSKPEEALNLFKKAFAENELYAIRTLFYLRDVRGGQGERTLFRTCLEWLGTEHPGVFEAIVNHVPEFGRWDDLFFDNEKCFALIADTITKDKNTEKPSILAKWLPTINASSANTRAKARFIADKLGLSDILYRKTVRDLRKKIDTVEEAMSARKWAEIDYSKVPSQASRIYKNAFKKHDEERYGKFIEKATKGEVKINSATLYPYQIYKSVTSDYSSTLDALWAQLPDYTQGKNAIVVADVSGSMSGDPMAVSVSLALYFADRNKGQFKDHFITFSARPKLQKVVGSTLRQKMACIENADWDGNTDLNAVFELILNTAVKHSTPVEEMPETIYIISDMQFDSACRERTTLEVIRDAYASAGYKIPNIVFWNVNASGKNVPAQRNEQGIALVSGFSPTVFKMAVENKSPEQVMLDTINSERYEKITL